MYAFPSEVSTVGVACAALATANYQTQAVADTQTDYDGSTTLGALGATGNPTRTAVIKSYTTTAKTSGVLLVTGTCSCH